MADEEPDRSVEQETIEGLWRVLLRLVPKRRRLDASALANALNYFLKRTPEETLRIARLEGFEKGYEAGQKAEADRAAGLALMTEARPDGPPTIEEELRGLVTADDHEPTKH